MTTAQYSTDDRRRERGSALIGVLLLLMMMSALVAALGVSARTETLVARNHQSAAQATAAAEAGLSHAVQVAIEYFGKSTTSQQVDAALDALLLDKDLLKPGIRAPGPRLRARPRSNTRRT